MKGPRLLRTIVLVTLLMMPGRAMGIPMQDEFPATSCSRADVEAAMSQAISQGGGTVIIPPGDCTWTYSGAHATHFETDVQVRLVGSGQGVTILRNAEFWLDGDGFREVAHMTMDGQGRNDCFYEKWRAHTPGVEIRLHHLTIGNYRTIGLLEGFYGVVDHCTFTQPATAVSYGWYVHGDGTYPDATPAFGAREALFFEDNTFEGYYHSVAGFCGARIVFRYNTVSNPTHTLDVHEPGYNYCGLGDKLEHGGRSFEVYDNTFVRASPPGAAINPRGGAGIIADNTIVNFSYGVQLSLEGGSLGPRCNQANGCPFEFDYDSNNCSDPDDGCCEGPYDFWVWNNTFNNVYMPFQIEGGHECMVEGVTYHLAAKAGYVKFTYPHPLVLGSDDLMLFGAPAHQAIHLGWQVNATLFPTSTWRITYDSQTGTAYLPITGIISPTRAYTLTGLTNYVWYTVTLNAILDSTPYLTDTVRVMPTDRLAYLPVVQR